MNGTDQQTPRDMVLDHYGRACSCCGSTHGLEIDDIDAVTHQRYRHWGSRAFYRWLIVRCFPPGFQTLCAVCNRSKNNTSACRLHQAV